MKPLRMYSVLVLLCAIAMVLACGCSSGSPASKGPAPAATQASGAVKTTAPVAAATTAECPDKLVWDGTWDSRWMGYAGNHDITTISFTADGSPDSWNGINAPAPTEVKMTQKCWDVTGTVVFATDPPCSGTIIGRIEKNQITGDWKTGGCEPEEGSSTGKFSLTMAADNKTWTGKNIGTKWLDWCSNCPSNWAGKRVS